MTTVVIAPAAASTAKTMAFTSWTLGLGFGLVDGQRSSAHIGSIERRDRLVGFTGIRHFDERETTRASRIPIGHKCDFFHGPVHLEDVSQLSFGCAVGQVPNVKVLHRDSSLSKSSMPVGVAVAFNGRPSESRGGAGSARIAWVRAMNAVRTFEIRRQASDAPALSQICGIRGKGVVRATHELVVGVLDRHLFSRIGKICEIF
jgi:hypothetical protein